MESAGTTFGGGMFLSPGGRFGAYLSPDGALGGSGSGGGGNTGASGAPSGSSGSASGGGSGSGGGTSGGGGGFQPPQGMRLVKDEDWNARDGFYSKAQEYGFKDADTLGRLKPLYETINKRQLDPAQLASMLSGEAPKQQQQNGQQYMTAEELDRRLSERDTRTKAEIEWEGHQKALPTKIQSRVSETIKAAGLKPDSGLGAMLTDAVNHRILQARMAAQWQDGHPLAGERLVAATDDIIEQVFTSGKFADSIKALRGEFLSSAAAANSGVSATAAGTGGQAGARGDKDEQDDRRARGIDTRSREEKEAIVRRNREAAGTRR